MIKMLEGIWQTNSALVAANYFFAHALTTAFQVIASGSGLLEGTLTNNLVHVGTDRFFAHARPIAYQVSSLAQALRRHFGKQA